MENLIKLSDESELFEDNGSLTFVVRLPTADGSKQHGTLTLILPQVESELLIEMKKNNPQYFRAVTTAVALTASVFGNLMVMSLLDPNIGLMVNELLEEARLTAIEMIENS